MRITGILLLSALFVSATCRAQQEQKDIYADPENLKVLPEDISSRDLGDTMKGFAMGLGLRCENCHVGEANTPLHTFDFASDEKDMKRKARVMMRMVQDINAEYVPRLNEITDSDRVEVRCVTCHRGRPQPKLIADLLDEQLAEHGVEAAVSEYQRLRGEYYGSHSYDFSEFSLPMYAQTLAADKQIAAAIALSRMNAEYLPDSYFAHFVLAELYSASGETAAAIGSYRRAAALNERAKPFLDAKIAELEASAK